MSRYRPTSETYQAGARTLPRETFVEPEVFAAERRRIFGRHWVALGREEEMPPPGTVRRRAVGEAELLLCRDAAGRLRTFHNTCRHRGTRLCEAAELQPADGRLVCPYHAWTYGLDGSLLAAPHMEEVPEFRLEEHGLVEAPLETWHGIVFVTAGLGAPPPSPAAGLAPLEPYAARYRLESLQIGARRHYEVAANWKLVFQNYSECLHCPVLHPQLARLTPYRTAANDLVEGPILGGPMEIRGGGSMTASGRACAPPIEGLTGEDLCRVFYYSIFPNLLLSLHPDYVLLHRLEPRAADRTEIHCSWLFEPAALADPATDVEDAVRFWDQTNREDWWICEQSQLGISSPAYTPGYYSPRESLPAAWDREYRRVMDGA